ncbi:hypothetical protein VOLCADRAFT_121477 [Volvox carteri f. nagariensis]|uniref:Uncharacterized protein n=1 Tax=Volvox carteri f. nagariensis TaxID=3068 RepID=D8UBB2_VOLCA|nr:uncharacterized protein VOLCADRAFT_121477 [Volvox carteri f. nagariensis]EFJ42971.1 hypothetical protein VOLCADRAFT_121477 [Volvox carteri f. nagariensis]|eukprot:XP_002956011.1 hypothetical protein VOLCADRAFT_121477 [Volvox carteri f. nagariensis]
MSSGPKANGNNNTGRPSRVDAARKWVAEETRTEAKEAFDQHTKETGNLDVLSRCKKLNELLSSDVLKGKGDAKAQLKEILGILHTGPKRPAFLDKPPVTASAGKRGASSSAGNERPLTSPANCTVANDVTKAAESPADGSSRRSWDRTAHNTLQRPSEEVEDIITLLNGPLPLDSAQVGVVCRTPQNGPGTEQQARIKEQKQKAEEAAEAAEQQRKAKEAAEAEEQQRKAKEAAEAAEQQRKAKEAAEAAEQQRKAKEAAEAEEQQRKAKEAAEAAEQLRKAKEAAEAAEQQRKAKEEAEAERQRAAAEALRLHRVQCGAAVCIQSHWRGYCCRRRAALRRQELAAQHAAASILQAAWRSRESALQYRQRLLAVGMLQCAVRAWHARRHLHHLRVEAFMRERSARVIQRAFLAYRARGYTLGPLRLPPGARPQSSLGVDGAALLAKQLRLRSAVDTRLAPECVANGSGGGGDDDSARQHRTVVTHMERMRQVSVNERNRRCDVSERAIMVASEHRDTAEALAIARQGFGTSTPRAPSPSTLRIELVLPLLNNRACIGQLLRQSAF